MEDAGQLARKASRGENGTLSIAVSGLIYTYIDIGQLCRDMLHKYPEVKLRIYDTLVSPATADMVRSGKCDIGFFASSNISQVPENLGFRKLNTIPLSFAIPASHPLAHKKDLKIQDFKNSHFIFPPAEETPRLRNHFESFFFTSTSSIIPLMFLLTQEKELNPKSDNVNLNPKTSRNISNQSREYTIPSWYVFKSEERVQ